ncbi:MULTISPECIES: PadR family transcriptional regulator [Pontibacillus]|uniref:PadR family transcriptional regulator n=1 Tax=Pontibacillus chungwhensis TaxID=265426 RepID=A0ABY8UTX8_9BACI|nr:MULTISPECIES: PadR family transcriptional regulator [Pontibacillus]MCD5323405.1 PadR family transcriptional regulator [Pontibacillus sp. HN14]WIF96785.1 PadR family transcriptional regulator [Pontibacillus chungwhensis]
MDARFLSTYYIGLRYSEKRTGKGVDIMKDKWLMQLRKGSYELAILLLLKERPMYGYEITNRLKETDELSIGGGAIYPVLKRMQDQELICYYWEDSEQGPAKKYYYLSKKGGETAKERMEVYEKMFEALRSFDQPTKE